MKTRAAPPWGRQRALAEPVILARWTAGSIRPARPDGTDLLPAGTQETRSDPFRTDGLLLPIGSGDHIMTKSDKSIVFLRFRGGCREGPVDGN